MIPFFVNVSRIDWFSMTSKNVVIFEFRLTIVSICRWCIIIILGNDVIFIELWYFIPDTWPTRKLREWFLVWPWNFSPTWFLLLWSLPNSPSVGNSHERMSKLADTRAHRDDHIFLHSLVFVWARRPKPWEKWPPTERSIRLSAHE